MKCEILCENCADDMEQRQGDGSQYEGEHIKYMRGVAKTNKHVRDGISICDHCSTSLPLGTPCAAVTIWADHSPYVYKPWESEFIK